MYLTRDENDELVTIESLDDLLDQEMNDDFDERIEWEELEHEFENQYIYEGEG